MNLSSLPFFGKFKKMFFDILSVFHFVDTETLIKSGYLHSLSFYGYKTDYRHSAVFSSALMGFVIYLAFRSTAIKPDEIKKYLYQNILCTLFY